MISENIASIKQRMVVACTRAGRNPSDVTLIAVSKTFPWEKVREVVEGGITDVGENYVQELLEKRPHLIDAHIRWHFIGHLQSNKARYIADWIHLVHSLDSITVANELHKQAKKSGRIIEVLIEVNTTDERSKFGVQPEHTVAFVESLAGLDSLSITGLMTIGPFLPDPEGSRPMFRRLRLLRDQIAGLHQPNVRMKHLSMGMTGDFEVAIEEGATLIRVGTAIFGSRTKPA
ncbi:MAG: YggS family pyridoxal phosphate-dependent enzyme [Bacteroidota bacterium]